MLPTGFDRQKYEELKQREKRESTSRGALPQVGAVNELLLASGIDPNMLSSLPAAGRSVVPRHISVPEQPLSPPVAVPDVTAVAEPPGLRRQPSIEVREPSLMQRAGQKIVETAQTHRELLEEANQVVTDFTKSVPKSDIRSLMIRGAAGVVTGIGSFLGADIPEAIGSVLAAEEGYRGEAAESKATEFATGMRELAGSALVVGDKILKKHLELIPDPFAKEAYEAYVEKAGGYKLMSLILGRKFTKEDYDKVVQQAIDRPEQPVFGALIFTGALKTGGKLGKKAAARFGPAIRETLTKKREFFGEGKVEKPRPATEEGMRAELTEMSDMAESFGSELFTKDQIKGMTRSELEYHTGRTKGVPSKEVAEYRKEALEVPERVEEIKKPVKAAKEPWEMTRGEFDKEFWFHGKGTEHPLYGKPQITGGATKSFKDAVRYSKNITPGKEGEIGEVYLIRKRELSGGARKELAWQIREQRRAGIKYKPSIVGSQKGRTLESKIVVPANVPAPHRFLVERAIAEGKPVPKEVLKDYLDLAKVAETPKAVAKELGVKYDGLQERPLTGPDGKMLRDADGKVIYEQKYQFTLTEAGKATTILSKELKDVAAKVAAKRAEYAKAEAKKPVPVELGFMGATPTNMAELSHNVGRGMDAIAKTAETVARKGTPDFLKQARNRGQDPTFKEIMRDIEVVDEKWHRRAGQGVEQLRDAGLKKLNDEQATSLADALEGKATPEQIKAAKPYRKALDEIYFKSKALGLKFNYTSKYFPRIWKTDVVEKVFDDVAPLIRELSEGKFSDQAIGKRLEAKKGITYQIVKHLLDTDQAKSYGAALRKLERDASAELFPESSFERPRKLELPSEVYERNAKKVLPAYIDVMTKRMAIAEKWGAPTGEKLNKKLSDLSLKNPDEAKIANKIVEMWSGEYERHHGLRGSARKLVDAYMGFETTTKIAGGTATIPNMTQTFISTLPEWGAYNTIRGGLSLMTSKGQKFAREAGIFRESMIQAYAGKEPKGLTGKITKKALTVSGFMAINKFNIAIASTTARHGIHSLHKAAQGTGPGANWAKKRLADFGLKPTDKLTKNLVAEKSFRFSIDSQLQRNVMRDPLIANDPRWRPFWLFKRFGYRQAAFSKDMFLREVKRGNPMPMLRMAAGGALGGEFVIWAKNQIKEFLSGEPRYRKEDLLSWHRFINNIAAVGSFGVISDIMDIEKLSDLYGGIKFTVSPVFVSDIENLGEAYLDITRDLEKYHDPKLTLERNYHHVLDNLGSLSRWTGKRLRTEPQKERGLTYAKGRERMSLLDLMIEGKKDEARRRVNLWNKNYPDNRFEAENFSLGEVKKRLRQNQRAYEQAKGTYKKKEEKKTRRVRRRR